MRTITIQVPDGDDIPGELAALEKELARVNCERDGICAAIRALRSRCQHPGMRHSRDVDGGRSRYCPVCKFSD